MMKLGFRLALASLAFTIGSAALAAPPPGIVVEGAQTVPGGRTLRVMVAQAEIKSDINPSNIAVATGGGLLGGLLAASQNASRTKRAEAAIEPLRTALGDFDADALALETTKAGLADISWLQPVDPTFSRDSSLLGKSAALDAGAGAQMAFVEYSYDVSPDFSSVRVVAKIEFANKVNAAANPAKPETRVLPKYLAYAQSITAIVSLPTPNADLNVNALAWSADGAKLARAGLHQAFSQIQQLLPRTLTLTAVDVAAMNGKDKPKGAAGGFAGRILETSATDTLLWNGGFIQVRKLS